MKKIIKFSIGLFSVLFIIALSIFILWAVGFMLHKMNVHIMTFIELESINIFIACVIDGIFHLLLCGLIGLIISYILHVSYTLGNKLYKKINL